MSQRTDESASRQIGRNFILLGGGQILSTALGLVLTASLTRTLGTTDFGHYYIILTIIAFVGLVVDWGQSNTVIREVARGRADLGSYLASALVLRLAGIAVAAVLAGSIAHISGYQPLVVWLSMFGVLVTLPAWFLALASFVFRGLDRTDLDVVAGLLTKIVATMATVAALHWGGGLQAAVLVPVVGGIVGFLYALCLSRRLNLRLSTPNIGTIREIFMAGLPVVVMAFTLAVQGIMDVTLLAQLTNEVVVGLFGAARSLIGVLVAPAFILAAASFPELSRTADNKTEFAAILGASVRPLMAVGALAACLLFTFAAPAVRFAFGRPEFAPSALILQISAVFFPIFFINSLMGNAAVALQKTSQIAAAKIVCVVICGISSWFLVPHFQAKIGNGAVGLMLAYGATEALMLGVFIALMPSPALVKIVIGYLGRALVAASVTAVVASTFTMLLPLWLAVGVVLVVYAIVAVALGLIRPGDIVGAMMAVRSAVQRLRGTA